MNTFELTSDEKTLANYDFAALASQAETAKINIANATTIDEIKTEICGIWSKIKPFASKLEGLPFVGKFITLLAVVLDALCG
jgi:hypothetical protein